MFVLQTMPEKSTEVVGLLDKLDDYRFWIKISNELFSMLMTNRHGYHKWGRKQKTRENSITNQALKEENIEFE